MTNSDLFSSIETYAKGKNRQSSKISAGFRIERKSSIKAIIEDDKSSISRDELQEANFNENASRSSERHYEYENDEIWFIVWT